MFKKNLSKRCIATAICSLLAFSVIGCGKDSKTEGASSQVSFEEMADDSAAESTSVEETDDGEAAEIPEGMYLSELTGEPISEEIKDQRPLCVMVDNEITALPHFGTAESDVVYEIMNSTANDRITRLMCVIKDWGKIEQMGSIRSTRPTNLLLAAEWNAVLCHDGGPYYINQYLEKPWAAHFSGTFSRVNNGKKREFTEYICKGDLEKNFSNNSGKAAYSTTYNEYANEGSHFNFVEYGKEVDLTKVYDKTYPATKISLPFWHNTSTLVYDEDSKMYQYYEYGDLHKDDEDGEPLQFKNVILQECSFAQLDEHGYLIYNCIDSGKRGWYITNGVAKAITWVKAGETDVTKYYDDEGKEIQINTGKTYISLVPDDTWDKMSIE
ncbi:MAG: DUF3048 domain-containing protein [Butyrivibrio sp.]|nr:DUF3048 domain-containing protein [Butyrivibrio sp.]